MKFSILAALLLMTVASFAQDSTEKPQVHVSGYVDAFYSYDFNKPKTTQRLPYISNYNRHNETSINFAAVKVEVNHSRYRAALTLHGGTWVNDNYGNESQAISRFSEAYVGVALNKKKNLWIDAGIMGSHVGFEGPYSINNLTATPSVAGDASPSYMSGAKVTYYPNSKLEVSAIVSNGWQRIQRLEGNTLPTFGTQLKYSPDENTVLNWSTMVGSDSPDSARSMKYYSDLYGIFKLDKFDLITGFDFGLQDGHAMVAPTAVLRYNISDKLATSAKAEQVSDPGGLLGNIPIDVIGYSLNFDYSPAPTAKVRFEGRKLNSNYAVTMTFATIIGK